MKLSARNVLRGIITAVHRGAVNSEVSLTLSTGESIVAIITNASAERLGLKPELDAFAIIKASSVMIGKDLDNAKLSTRNILTGTVSRVVEGEVDDEIHLALARGSELVAIITKQSAQRLGLIEGDTASALIKASSVILGVD